MQSSSADTTFTFGDNVVAVVESGTSFWVGWWEIRTCCNQSVLSSGGWCLYTTWKPKSWPKWWRRTRRMPRARLEASLKRGQKKSPSPKMARPESHDHRAREIHLYPMGLLILRTIPWPSWTTTFIPTFNKFFQRLLGWISDSVEETPLCRGNHCVPSTSIKPRFFWCELERPPSFVIRYNLDVIDVRPIHRRKIRALPNLQVKPFMQSTCQLFDLGVFRFEVSRVWFGFCWFYLVLVLVFRAGFVLPSFGVTPLSTARRVFVRKRLRTGCLGLPRWLFASLALGGGGVWLVVSGSPFWAVFLAFSFVSLSERFRVCLCVLALSPLHFSWLVGCLMVSRCLACKKRVFCIVYLENQWILYMYTMYGISCTV